MHPGNNNSWIQKYVGLPFETRGRGPTGYDCWGLVQYVYREELGILLPDYSDDYQDEGDKNSISEVFAQERGKWTRVEDPKPLDCVMFNIYGRPVHIGVVATAEFFLHSPENDLSRLERFGDRIWARRIEGFYRHAPV